MEKTLECFKRILGKSKKENIDILIRGIFGISALISASVIIIIIIFITIKGVTPFISYNQGLGQVNIFRFLTGRVWLDGAAFSSSLYGVGFIIINTVYIALLSLMISMPIGVLTALFIAKVAPQRLSIFLRTVVELLSAIPSIVYGLFGSGVILVLVYNFAELVGIQSKGGNSVIATVLVLSLMSLPTITAISEVAIRSVGKDIELGSLALGATKTQTNFKVVLASAKSGIFASAILGVGRALGEATAVSLVAGNSKSGPSLGLFDITSTLTSTMLEGLKETTGLDYDIRFSVGIVLMIVILLTNIILNYVKRKVGSVSVK
ncbi:phosphate ABC transporter permease subunit PstC [Candidatus Izimaplasma bacterium ZiA1]|uniref:phosphate ABC transporter permease subunit PstC n=1 Tax=Candidatus Izimoplasma sp. ZiA1 TaxID=2024899 RepID=UPI000BAA6832|nr:phosphate ABC transporter permease subunit PstC [Candidatus Izimaplasma bacterium ZiA1]